MPHFTHVRRSPFAVCGLMALGLLTACSAQAQLSVFSPSPYNVPETISVAPAGFGVYGGQLFIPDATNNVIYALPQNGGAPTVFASSAVAPVGANSGLFVPASFGGAAGGKYVAFSVNGNSSAIDSSGAGTPFVSVSGGQFSTSLIAPASFGAYSNQIIAMDESASHMQALAIDASGNATKIAGFTFEPFGSLVAPAGFGSLGGKILVDNGFNGGDIVALGADGSVTPFTNVPLKAGQVGLRQMALAPAGFFPDVNKPLLLVSVTGSRSGGGTLGDVVAIDSDGNIVESLRDNLGITAFDPRGLYFLDDKHLLLSDSSHTATRQGQILELTSNAFAATTPEPGAVTLFAALFAVGGACLRSRRSRRA